MKTFQAIRRAIYLAYHLNTLACVMTIHSIDFRNFKPSLEKKVFKYIFAVISTVNFCDKLVQPSLGVEAYNI